MPRIGRVFLEDMAGPGAAINSARVPPLRVETLQPEVLITALGFLPDADLLAFVCTCRSFRATVQAQNQYAAESVAAGRAGGLVARPVQLPPVAHLVQSVALYEWAQRDFGFSQFDEKLCSATAEAGSSDLLQLLRQRGCPWKASDICRSAAAGGHLPVLQWARANGCAWDTGTCSLAAANGHLEVLQWARANGCDWSWYTCAKAAENGHLEVLQWARANGCDWDATTSASAAVGRQLEVLRWAMSNGCMWDEGACAEEANNEGEDLAEVLEWAREHGFDV